MHTAQQGKTLGEFRTVTTVVDRRFTQPDRQEHDALLNDLVLPIPVWPYWNLMDFTPEGCPDRQAPPQNFWSKFLEDNFLNPDK